jgi:hypothetical protein
VPLLVAGPISERARNVSVIVSAAIALAAVTIGAMLPTFSNTSRQRLNLIYLEGPDGAHWVADPSWEARTTGPLPAPLGQVGGFSHERSAYVRLNIADAYVATAGAARLALPTVTAVGAPSGPGLRALHLQLHGSSAADAMILQIPAAARLRRIDVGAEHLIAPRGWSGDTRLECLGADCRDRTVTLVLAGDASGLRVVEERTGLPPFGAFLQAARPETAMPSQNGDQVMLVNSVPLP